ncbi:MAG: 50S ribosomal protein L21 [Chloroflexi bacterium]|nr:50S ribosomal protein L21 [Chloroflexota bacterium]
MYAVVTTGGKQYRVEAGSELVVERLAAAGASVTFDRVLLVGEGEAVTIGTPTVDGASVSGTILGEELGPKLIIFKFKQKATYRRTRGHRQHLVRVRIDEITASGRTSKGEQADTTEAAPKKPAKASESARADDGKKPARKRTTAAAKADSADVAPKPAARRRSPAKKAESKE